MELCMLRMRVTATVGHLKSPACNHPAVLNPWTVPSPADQPRQHKQPLQCWVRVDLFPLDRGRRFTGDVVHYPVDAIDLIDDATADQSKKFVG